MISYREKESRIQTHWSAASEVLELTVMLARSHCDVRRSDLSEPRRADGRVPVACSCASRNEGEVARWSGCDVIFCSAMRGL